MFLLHIIDDLPTDYEKRIAMKRKHDLTPYKCHVSCRYSTATSPLEPRTVKKLKDLISTTFAKQWY
jgi:hypothetical protein